MPSKLQMHLHLMDLIGMGQLLAGKHEELQHHHLKVGKPGSSLGYLESVHLEVNEMGCLEQLIAYL